MGCGSWSSAASTMSMARRTPAQKPWGLTRTMVFCPGSPAGSLFFVMLAVYPVKLRRDVIVERLPAQGIKGPADGRSRVVSTGPPALLIEWRGKMFRRLIIRINNVVTALRRVRVKPANLLLLVPHCLQDSKCVKNLMQGINNCARCGLCNAAELLKLRDELGIRCNIAGGGRQAVQLVRDAETKAVVAVACEKELVEGIMASFPKPVHAVINIRPFGPCKDTEVDMTKVREAVEKFLDRTGGTAAARPESGHKE
ncbi:MAG: hypothetical protein C0404_09875 [Verrucomicrobia bacterium]|nr:hypothetical protein [Verrucomicrobiota bacterium]